MIGANKILVSTFPGLSFYCRQTTRPQDVGPGYNQECEGTFHYVCHSHLSRHS